MRTGFLRRETIPTVVAVALVGVAACLAAPRNPLTEDEISALAVPRASKPPVIDGKIDPVEWREAVAASGLVALADNTLIPRPTTYFVAWDPKHLYLACRTYLKPGYKPFIRDGRSPGMAFVFDDGLEMIFKPMGKNLSAEHSNTAYKLFMNCLGNLGDMTRLDLGQQLKDWEPKFQVAVRIAEPGSAPNGGSWWELEVSTSPEDFQLTGDHQVGDEWRVMFGFNHIPIFMQTRIPCVGPYFEASGYTRLKLMENVPAAQFTMDSLSNLASDGTAHLKVRACSPVGKPSKVVVHADVAGKIVKDETLAIPAGEERTFALNEKLPADLKEGKLQLKVTEGQTCLLNYVAYFSVGKFSHVLAPVKPRDPNKFALRATFNPVRRLLLVKGDTYDLPDPDAARSLSYVVKAEEDGSVAAQGEITQLIDWYFEEVVSLPEIRPGKYTVEAALGLAGGKSLGPVTSEFEKKDEAEAYPEWWGKGYGDVERVLPPFAAMACKGQTVTCWGREYTLNALGLPEAISSQSAPVLASPARVVAVVDGAEIAMPLGEPSITEAKDWRVRFKGAATGGGLELSAEGWVEQDGLVYVDLTYGPDAGKTLRIDALRIEYPLAEADADCLLCIGPGGNFSSKTTMLLPKDKQGRLWSTLNTGRPGSQMTVGSFYPTVWVGNERRGFLWWGDSDQGWFPDDAVPAHEAVRTGNAVVLRNNLIGKPVRLDGKRTVSFSYMATPFKPFTKGWRMVAATEDGTFIVPHRGVREDSQTGKMINPGGHQNNIIHPESRDPEEWGALWKQQKTEGFGNFSTSADAFVQRYLPFDPYAARNTVGWCHMSFTLSGYGPITLEPGLFGYFGSEWQSGGHRPWNPTCTDYAMYLFHRAFSEGGVVSTYWDITFPTLWKDLLTGCCYRLPDGRIQRGYNGWNQRRFFMRLHAVSHDNGLLPNCNGSHSTHAYVTVAMPWLDGVLDGERTWNLDVTDNDWVDYYPIDRMRAMSVPHNWGTPICWMGNLVSADVAKGAPVKAGQTEWVWMHDSWCNPYLRAQNYDRTYPDTSRMPRSVLDWGLNQEGVVYHPYWRNPFVRSEDPDILISLWQIPGSGTGGKSDRVLLGIFNYDRAKAKAVSLKVDLDKLGLVPELKWQEFIGVRDLFRRDAGKLTDREAAASSAKLDFYGRILSISKLPPHTMRLVGIRRY